MFNLFRNIKRQHWSDATWWLFATLIGALMPFWLTWFFLILFQLPANINLFTQKGEIAIYSASLLTTAFYLVTKDYAPTKLRNILKAKTTPTIKSTFPAQTFFVYLCLIITLLSALLFAGTTIWHFPGVTLNINAKLVNVLSLIFFIASTGISYLIAAIDNSAAEQTDEDFRKLLHQGQVELENQFDSLDKE
jgi:hypothetical protein